MTKIGVLMMDLPQLAKRLRKEKDKFMKDDSNSPLTPKQKKKFKKIDYFPYEPKYRFEGAIEHFEDKTEVEIGTNKGELRKYRLFGKFSFEINGQQLALHIFQSLDETHFFVPFMDATSGNETYGAGRYVELEELEPDIYVLDFNFAYNPYCAYNDSWSCPLVPPINRLPLRVEAGEKTFAKK
ncbi:MAG: DUF1684 domain-containing protein [Candidatus Hodarchaeota archaeon]